MVGTETTPFKHFWEMGINSPHSALTLRADYQVQMTELHANIGYTYTRIHAPFARDYSVAQGPNTTSYFNAFRTYDFLLSIGMKPWIELGYTPCWMSGPAAVPANSYWPTVDYGLCVGSPAKMEDWTHLIDGYVGTMIERYGLQEVESWVWVLYNEPGGINAYSREWQTGEGGFSYYDMFFNTSLAIKKHSKNITFGGLSDSPDQAQILVDLSKGVPEREGAFDIFTYHSYCNGQTATSCAESQVNTVDHLRAILPATMPIYLEETGSTAGPYTPFHDQTGEAAFVVPYVAAMQEAGLAGAHWWCASDIYTEHGSIPNYTWIPHEAYSGGMPRSEFTGRWGFTTPSGVAKPIHRAFQLLHAAGQRQIGVSPLAGSTCGTTTIDGASSANVQVLALGNGTAILEDVMQRGVASSGRMIFVSNTGHGTCNVTLRGLQSPSQTNQPSAMLHTIDSVNGNPYGLWQSMGSPSFPTPLQTTLLKSESALQPTRVTLGAGGTSVMLQVEPQALLVLVL